MREDMSCDVMTCNVCDDDVRGGGCLCAVIADRRVFRVEVTVKSSARSILSEGTHMGVHQRLVGSALRRVLSVVCVQRARSLGCLCASRDRYVWARGPRVCLCHVRGHTPSVSRETCAVCAVRARRLHPDERLRAGSRAV